MIGQFNFAHLSFHFDNGQAISGLPPEERADDPDTVETAALTLEK